MLVHNVRWMPIVQVSWLASAMFARTLAMRRNHVEPMPLAQWSIHYRCEQWFVSVNLVTLETLISLAN